MFKTLDDIGTGKRVLVRLDLNSPVEEGVVQDNRRFSRHARTVRELREGGHHVVCMAHQGRPGRDSFVSLEQHADILADHVDHPVQFVDDVCGERAVDAVRSLESGEILLLENVRMCGDELPERPPEEHAESEFVRALAPEFDAYVNDAYSAAHRSHASLVGFPLVLDSYAGRVMEREYEANTSIANREFDGPVTMVLGGAKATDVVDVMDALDQKVDTYLLGGVVGELFLRAEGYDVGYDVGGTDVFDYQWERNEGTIERLLIEREERVRLPSDLAYEADGEREECQVEGVEKDRPFPDIGHDTIEAFQSVIEESAAVFVKGAMGVFEDERFSDGTVEILRAIGETDCFSVVGGGDTSRAITLYGLDEDDFSHVSIAGGAYVNALTGSELPAVEALCD
ncbi:phosphoglycerate kinase [Salinirarus marinus]|uniref:phosphoglycerate kinase n=1 Tax=Salinirarus marinus TaxID=3068310 RepID=UPI003C6CC17E